MEIKDLQERVAKAEERVDKCKATIQRHEAQLAKKTDKYEIEWKQSDIKGATSKLQVAEEVLANWIAKLNVEIEKERFLEGHCPAIIKEFLEQWKVKAYDWHVKSYVRYVEIKEALKEAKELAQKAYKAKYPSGRTWGKEYDTFIATECKEVKEFSGALVMFGGLVARMDTYYKETERLAYLEKELEADKKAKMLDLINRVNAVVGSITDAAGMRISEKGNLDGIIVGTEGSAKVETIGAGGYNIQCFHFRTLVHKLNEVKG